MARDSVRHDHPSFGKIVVTKGQGSERFLFGSEMGHRQTIHIEIKTAYMERHLNHDWLGEGKTVASFEMSEAQWGHFVSSFGDGTGTPITFGYIKDEPRIPSCPKPQAIIEKFDTDLKKSILEATSGAANALGILKELRAQKKPATKAQLDDAITAVESSVMEVRSNIPYIAESLKQKMEHTVSESMTEVEAFMQRRIHEVGLQTLSGQLPHVLGADKRQGAPAPQLPITNSAPDKSTPWVTWGTVPGYECRENERGGLEVRPMGEGDGITDEKAKPAPDREGEWECNQCGAREYTGSVSADDIQDMACTNCGGDEFHYAQ